jgi:S-DNA-T family DNA segregation ATPase FtsK/SpoIIIE
MIVINSGDQVPDLVILTLARLLWRYRSELAPPMVAAVTTLTSWRLHGAHPRWWPILALCTAVAMLGAALVGRRIGLTTRVERAYAVTVVAAAGGWMAAATSIGPFREPLPDVLLAGASLLAVPWWAHRRRRARVRVERALAAWPEIAAAVGLGGSRLMSAVVDVWGWRARFALARGQTIQDVIAKLPALESALGTHRGAVRAYPTTDDLANRFELRVLDSDPHADAITWPGRPITSIPSRSTSGRSRTPYRPVSCCYVVTRSSVECPGQARAAASTSSWAT